MSSASDADSGLWPILDRLARGMRCDRVCIMARVTFYERVRAVDPSRIRDHMLRSSHMHPSRD
jgi:hypothetical protein